MKSVRIWSFSGPYFPAFELNKERDPVSIRIQSKCGDVRTRNPANTDTFDTVHVWSIFHFKKSGKTSENMVKKKIKKKKLKKNWNLPNFVFSQACVRKPQEVNQEISGNSFADALNNCF